LVRGAGGHEDHPTVSNFIQLYRILSLYTPVKKITKGNVASDENETLLVSFQDSLKTHAKEVGKRKLEWKDEIHNIIKGKASEAVQASSEGCSSLDANIVYHLSGYVVFKSKNFSSCQNCLTSIETSNLKNLPAVADLSKIMDYGCVLKYPSLPLFKLICFVVEPALVKMIEKKSMYGDMVKNILTSLDSFSVKDIGCELDDHKFELLSKVIPFYIVTRLYFYVRSVRNDLGHGKATKKNRKLAKLQAR